MRFLLALFALMLCTPSSPATAEDRAGARQIVVERVEVTLKPDPEHEDDVFERKPRTQRVVVERYLGFGAGHPLRPEDLLTGRQRLEETGFFKSVDVFARPGSARGQVVVVVELDERQQPQYRFEGGHGELDGWYIVPVGFVYDNPWGRGHELDWKWYVGSHGDGTRWHYGHPRLFGGAGTLDLYKYSEDRSYPQWRGGTRLSQHVKAEGVSVRVDGVEGRFRNLFAEVRTQQLRPDRDEELIPLLGNSLRKAWMSSLSLGWLGDTRDNAQFPTEGFWGRAALTQSLGGRLGDDVFTRLDVEGRWYHPLNGKVAALRLLAGLTGDSAPFYERYYLGGPYSNRRFERAEATPVGWGTRTLQAQIELRLPFGRRDESGPRNTGVLFYDVGGIWRPGEFPSPVDLEHAMGAGYRRSVRVLGILRLDMSLPIVPTQGENHWEAFHLWLTLGRAF